MTKELIERLRDTASKGVSVWGDLQMEAAKEIEILTAEREAYASAMDRMKAELAAIKAREPVAWRWRMNGQWHYGPEPLFKDGFTTQEPLYDKPIPPVREPLSDNTIAALRQAIVQPARQVPTTNYVQPVPDHCDRITWRNRYYHLPLAAALPYGPRPTFGAIGSRDVDVAEAQRAWDKAMAAQPAQVPAGSIRLWDTQWASIVNHDNAYNGWSTNDAVNHAVRMTERYISANVAQNNLPPLPAAQEVK